jgi:hypothetical protein
MFLRSLFDKIKQDGVLNNPVALYSLASSAARNMKLSESITELDTMVTLAGALRQVDTSRMIFTSIPTYALGGAYEGRLGLLQEESDALFDKIRNDVPVEINATP